MPKYRIETDQGNFEVELDQPPKDQAELRSLAQQAIADQMAGSKPVDLRALREGPGRQIGEAIAPALEFAGKAALPFAGGVLGGAAGTIAAPFLGPAGPAAPVLGMMGGAGLGEAANQAFGLTESDPAAVMQTAGFAGAGNVMAGGAAKLARLAARGTRSGRAAIQDWAVRTAQEMPPWLKPNTTAAQAYEQVALHNPDIAMPRTLAAARQLLKAEEGLSDPSGLILDVMGKMERAIVPPPPPAPPASGLLNQYGKAIPAPPRAPATAVPRPFQEVFRETQRAKARIEEIGKRGGVEEGAFKLILKAMTEDMEAAANAPGVQGALPAAQALKRAVDIAKRHFAADDLSEQITKAISVQQGTNYQSFNAGQVIRWLKGTTHEAEMFKKAVSPAELNMIESRLLSINLQPGLLKAPGVVTGSSQEVRRGVIGGAIANTLGMSGWTGAAAVALTAKVGDGLARMLMTEKGRRFLTYTGGNFNHQSLALAATALKSGAWDEPGPTLRAVLPKGSPSPMETLAGGGIKAAGGISELAGSAANLLGY